MSSSSSQALAEDIDVRAFLEALPRKLGLSAPLQAAVAEVMFAALEEIKTCIEGKLPSLEEKGMEPDWSIISTITLFAEGKRIFVQAHQLAKTFGDEKLVKKVEYMGHIKSFVVPYAQFKVWHATHTTRQSQVMNAEVVEIVRMLLSAKPHFDAFLALGGHAAISTPSDKLNVLDNITALNLKAFTDDFQSIIESLCIQWMEDLENLGNAVASWMPGGWQAKKNLILEDMEVLFF